MRRLLVAACAVGAVVFVPTLATGVGVTGEPMRPIVAMSDPIIYTYPGPRVGIPCDGSAVWGGPNARIEADVTADPAWPDRQAASEHWTFRVSVIVRHKVGATRIWDDEWRHANIPPAWRFGKFEAAEINLYNIRATPGEWRITLTLTADMSRAVFRRECRFRVPA